MEVARAPMHDQEQPGVVHLAYGGRTSDHGARMGPAFGSPTSELEMDHPAAAAHRSRNFERYQPVVVADVNQRSVLIDHLLYPDYIDRN